MLIRPKPLARPQSGVSLIEVLVTLLLLSFGLLGYATLVQKLQLAEMESNQRAQAVLLVNDMVERINSSVNKSVADPATVIASYLTSSGTPTWLGVGDGEPSSCSGLSTGSALDLCQWSNALKGAAEANSKGPSTVVTGARGCIELVTAENIASGTCTPGVYRVTVTWQGLSSTVKPSLACAANQYGSDDTQRRALSLQFSVGLDSCT